MAYALLLQSEESQRFPSMLKNTERVFDNNLFKQKYHLKIL